MGAVSGLTGGSGANSKGAITNTLDLTAKTIKRESVRANVVFAQKMTLSIKQYRKINIELIANPAIIGYTKSEIINNGIFTLYTDKNVKNHIVKIFE